MYQKGREKKRRRNKEGNERRIKTEQRGVKDEVTGIKQKEMKNKAK
jgi:hypothetical protein